MNNFLKPKTIVSCYGLSSFFKVGMKNTLTTPTVPTVGIELASTSAKRFRDIAILAGFCLVLLFFGLGELPFYSRGEQREGLVVSYVFGRVDEFTLRLSSALLATAAVLVIYQMAARLWGQRAAIIAGVVLATCAEWWQAGTETQVDMTLAFFVSAACLYFDLLYHEHDVSLLKALGLPLLLGLATLAKGPIGLALPGIIFLIFLFLRRDFAFVRRLHPFVGGIVFLVIAGWWYAAALLQD